MRVCTHPNVLPQPWTIAGAWNFLEAMLSAPGGGLLLPSSRHAAIFAEVAAELSHLRGNILHDTHTAVLSVNTESAISTRAIRISAAFRFCV